MSNRFINPDTERALSAFASGVVGLGKVAFGIDRPEPETIERRMATCRECPSGLYRDGFCAFSEGGCGCFVQAKVRVESESCPMGHW